MDFIASLIPHAIHLLEAVVGGSILCVLYLAASGGLHPDTAKAVADDLERRKNGDW